MLQCCLGLIRPFCSANNIYVMRYENMLSSVNQKEEEITRLTQELQLVQQVSKTSLLERQKVMLYKLFKKPYEVKGVRLHREVIKELSEKLSYLVEINASELETARKAIKKVRSQRMRTFLIDLLSFEHYLETQINQKNLSHKIKEAMAINHRMLLTILQKQGLSVIQCRKGEKFDSSLHETNEWDPPANATIIKMKKKGWKYNSQEIVVRCKVEIHPHLNQNSNSNKGEEKLKE